MAVCKCTGEEVLTPQDEQLMGLLDHYRGYDGALIPVLQGRRTFTVICLRRYWRRSLRS